MRAAWPARDCQALRVASIMSRPARESARSGPTLLVNYVPTRFSQHHRTGQGTVGAEEWHSQPVLGYVLGCNVFRGPHGSAGQLSQEDHMVLTSTLKECASGGGAGSKLSVVRR